MDERLTDCVACELYVCCIRYAMGLIPTRGSLAQCEKITASSFCRSAHSAPHTALAHQPVAHCCHPSLCPACTADAVCP